MVSYEELQAENERLKKQLGLSVKYPCPDCGVGQSLCTTIKGGVFVHDCNGKFVERPHRLKKGQKSLLVKGLKGE